MRRPAPARIPRIPRLTRRLALPAPLRRLAGRVPAARRPAARRLALVLALAVLAGAAVVLWPRQDDLRITAYFPRTVGIYPGSDVRVLGVRVGEVTEITPQGDRVRVRLELPADRRIPADAKAAIINSSVVSDRYVQLLPVYRKGPALEDGAVIPEERTAVPVELDRVYESLHTTAEALGPEGANEDGSLSRLLGVSADTLDGQGERIHQTVEDLSEAVTTLSDGRGDLFDTVRGLQVFTSALADDDDSVRAFNDSLADVADQLAGERKDLGKAIRHLAAAMADVSAFVRDNEKSITSNVKGLSKVTRIMVEQRAALEEFVDVAPAGLSNLDLAYNPASGTLDTRNNPHFPQDPASLLCSLLRTAGEDGRAGKDCADIRELFDSLPELPDSARPLGDGPAAGTPGVDRTLGGILEARA
ncbi:hypothetical protein SUDANB106_02665 [Streptomyces sp. enrichment culture]